MFPLLQAFWQRRRWARLLPRHLRGELPPRLRREVGRALDTPYHHADYQQQRAAQNHFEAELGGIGRAERGLFQRGWADITRALEQADSQAYRLSPHHTFDWRMRIAALGMATALLIPLGLGTGRAAASSIPTPPTAHVIAHDGTPTGQAAPHIQDPAAHATPTAPAFTDTP